MTWVNVQVARQVMTREWASACRNVAPIGAPRSPMIPVMTAATIRLRATARVQAEPHSRRTVDTLITVPC